MEIESTCVPDFGPQSTYHFCIHTCKPCSHLAEMFSVSSDTIIPASLVQVPWRALGLFSTYAIPWRKSNIQMKPRESEIRCSIHGWLYTWFYIVPYATHPWSIVCYMPLRRISIPIGVRAQKWNEFTASVCQETTLATPSRSQFQESSLLQKHM